MDYYKNVNDMVPYENKPINISNTWTHITMCKQMSSGSFKK